MPALENIINIYFLICLENIHFLHAFKSSVPLTLRSKVVEDLGYKVCESEKGKFHHFMHGPFLRKRDLKLWIEESSHVLLRCKQKYVIVTGLLLSCVSDVTSLRPISVGEISAIPPSNYITVQCSVQERVFFGDQSSSLIR